MTTRTNYQARPGVAQCDRIVKHLQDKGPQTMAKLCEALGFEYSNLWVYVKRMRTADPKRVHVSGWEPRNGRPAPIIAAGNRPDVEFVPLRRPVPKISAEERRQQVLKLLGEKPRTAVDLAKAMHMVRDGALFYVAQLRKEQKVYISKWLHPSKAHPNGKGGSWAPVYAVGDKTDKKRPKPETSKQRNARLAKDPAYRAARNKKRKARYIVERLRKKPQTIFAALGI